MSRLPIRLRLTLAFALAMAVVLAATGAFLYLRLGASLNEGINDSLESRLAEVSSLVHNNAPVAEIRSEETFAKVIDPAEPGSLLSPAEVQRVKAGHVFRVEHDAAPGVAGRVRLLATRSEGRVVVAGASLDDREEALRKLLAQLLIGGPAALLLASFLGYGLARAALRPVESIRAEAAIISGEQPVRRLPVPRARDEIARLATTLNGMLERLERSRARERRFVADASHELRTPLALLKAELELARRDGRSTEELSGAVSSAAEEVDRLIRLAEDLLVLARLDEGGLPVHVEPLDLRDFLTDVARGRRITVTAPVGVTLEGDRLRLEQAVSNLLDNALRHGGGTIELAATVAGDRVELHVRDEGPGFPLELLEHAFERFSRAGSARSHGHAGLGLAIVDSVAKAHGGLAGATNHPQGGADVWIALPLTAISSRVPISAVEVIDQGGTR
jgi:two-component system OmpR family sensor kinase